MYNFEPLTTFVYTISFATWLRLVAIFFIFGLTLISTEYTDNITIPIGMVAIGFVLIMGSFLCKDKS